MDVGQTHKKSSGFQTLLVGRVGGVLKEKLVNGCAHLTNTISNTGKTLLFTPEGEVD